MNLHENVHFRKMVDLALCDLPTEGWANAVIQRLRENLQGHKERGWHDVVSGALGAITAEMIEEATQAIDELEDKVDPSSGLINGSNLHVDQALWEYLTRCLPEYEDVWQCFAWAERAIEGSAATSQLAWRAEQPAKDDAIPLDELTVVAGTKRKRAIEDEAPAVPPPAARATDDAAAAAAAAAAQ